MIRVGGLTPVVATWVLQGNLPWSGHFVAFSAGTRPYESFIGLAPTCKWKIDFIPVPTLVDCSWLPRGLCLGALGGCFGLGGVCHYLLAMSAMDTLRERASPIFLLLVCAHS